MNVDYRNEWPGIRAHLEESTMECFVTAKTSGATACPSSGKQCSSIAEQAVLFDCCEKSEDTASPKTPMQWHKTLTLCCDKAVGSAFANRDGIDTADLKSFQKFQNTP